MNKSTKILFLLLVFAVIILTTVHKAKADDGGDNEREDSRERESGHTEVEDDHEDWDFSDDFDVRQTVQKPVVVKTVYQEPIVVETVAPLNYSFNESFNVSLNDSNFTSKITIPEINLSAYEDYDGDGVINKYDMYPGADDRLYVDSDNDTIVDAYDKYPGANDLDFEDRDNDGVIDSKDSNIGKMTDKDHDGIDDTYDTHDDRRLFTKIIDILGLMRH